MIINEGVFTSTFATNMIFQDQLISSWPKHVATYLGKGYLGLSFSYDRENAYLAACGEYAERSFFNKKIRGECRRKITDLPDHNRIHLQSFIEQLCPYDLIDTISEHEFEMCSIKSIFDDTTILVPTSVISIGEQVDSRFIASRDTTGNSAHFNEGKCFDNSLLEFVERQSLITSFLFSTGKRLFKLDDLAVFGDNSDLITNLLNYGEIHAADISLFNNVYTILLCFSSSKTGASVKYSVGCSSSFSIKEAFENSAKELYSSFVTMMSIYDKDDSSFYDEYEKNMDYYLKLFYKKNHRHTYLEFGIFDNNKALTTTTSEAAFYPLMKKEDLLKDIYNLSKKVYCFKSKISFPGGVCLHFCKLISLELFYTMDISRKCNLINNITSIYGSLDSQKLSPIPFP